jgi:hypothetical protein
MFVLAVWFCSFDGVETWCIRTLLMKMLSQILKRSIDRKILLLTVKVKERGIAKMIMQFNREEVRDFQSQLGRTLSYYWDLEMACYEEFDRDTMHLNVLGIIDHFPFNPVIHFHVCRVYDTMAAFEEYHQESFEDFLMNLEGLNISLLSFYMSPRNNLVSNILRVQYGNHPDPIVAFMM